MIFNSSNQFFICCSNNNLYQTYLDSSSVSLIFCAFIQSMKTRIYGNRAADIAIVGSFIVKLDFRIQNCFDRSLINSLHSMLNDLVLQLRHITKVSTSDLPLLGIVSGFYLLYRYFMCNFIINKIGSALNVKNLFKFTHRGFDLIHYTVTGTIGLLAMSQRPYFHCVYYAAHCGEFLSQNPNGFECSVFEKVYYILFTAYYIVDLFYMKTSSEPGMILIHHIVCLSMIFSCVVLKSPVVGPSIMLLHDAVDIPLYLGKILLYLGFGLAKDISLAIFAILCTWFRIINYPMIIYHCIQIACGNPEYPTLYRGTCALLCALYILHLIWEEKIMENVIEIIQGSPIHDNRSDKAE